MTELYASQGGRDDETMSRTPRAFLECLTGPSKGQTKWLTDSKISAVVLSDGRLELQYDDAKPTSAEEVAKLFWEKNGYSIHAAENRQIWVNGHQISSIKLMHGDMIEFEKSGPMSRYRLCDQSYPHTWTIDDIFSDAIAYAKSSRRPVPDRFAIAVKESARRLARQTTIFFRVSVVLALCVIAAVSLLLYQNDRRLERSLEQDARRIEAVTILLTQTRQEALTEDALSDLRAQIDLQVQRQAERLSELENRSTAPSRIITEATSSVAFLQGAFGLRHDESGEFLREVIGNDGEQLKTPFGQPRIEPFGNGPPAEFQFTGTGFLLNGGSALITNRHLVEPWTSGDRLAAFEASGLQPELLKIVVFLPDVVGPIETKILGISKTADLAVLSLENQQLTERGLSLSNRAPRAGEELYLLGYPTGLKALLARADQEIIRSISDGKNTDFWSIAETLSETRQINPLASRGIVAQVGPGFVVYDAQTTVGGSGGPALNRNGDVVAVNRAILPEFGGSNIGVPVNELEKLLEQLGIE